jgi:hypothetical protein
MKRSDPCNNLCPDYNRLEDAFYISRDPDTYEVSWPFTRMMDELKRLGLVNADCREDRMETSGTSR